MKAEQSFICPTKVCSWNMLSSIPLFSNQMGWRQHSTQEPWSPRHLFLASPSFSLKQLKNPEGFLASQFFSLPPSEVTVPRWGLVLWALGLFPKAKKCLYRCEQPWPHAGKSSALLISQFGFTPRVTHCYKGPTQCEKGAVLLEYTPLILVELTFS